METEPRAALPTDAKERKNMPLVRGLLDYFPAALAAVADVSRVGNEQHNPGQPMHHARGKSTDHADCIVRHLMDRGIVDSDGLRHSAKVAWRALALLQEELEAAGAPLARGAKVVEAPKPAEPIAQQSCRWIVNTRRGIGEREEKCGEPGEHKDGWDGVLCDYHLDCVRREDYLAGRAPIAGRSVRHG